MYNSIRYLCIYYILTHTHINRLHDCRTVNTIQKETGVNNVHLVTMAMQFKGLNVTAGDACVLLAQVATSELTTVVALPCASDVVPKQSAAE